CTETCLGTAHYCSHPLLSVCALGQEGSAAHFDYGPAHGRPAPNGRGQPGAHHGPPFTPGTGVFSYPGGPTTLGADYLRLSRRQQRSAQLCLSCWGYRRSQRGGSVCASPPPSRGDCG